METAGGHHWAAQRIPDDAYVIAPNQTGIQEIDFDDPDSFMFSKDLRKFAQAHHLNPSSHFNFRKIFGSDTQLDRHYNTPRAWYGQRYFDPESVKDKTPMSNDLPFICHANRKITIEDIKFVLSSHYQDTPYDHLRLVQITRQFHTGQLESTVTRNYPFCSYVQEFLQPTRQFSG